MCADGLEVLTKLFTLIDTDHPLFSLTNEKMYTNENGSWQGKGYGVNPASGFICQIKMMTALVGGEGGGGGGGGG